MTHEQLWREFSERFGITAEYSAWSFGDDADTLAELVRAGIKTSTSSALPLYELENEPLPQIGEYSVVLDSRDEAVCVIRTEAVRILPFDEIGAEHARREGEGDRSLEYWREVHVRFFTSELAEAGLTFDFKMPTVCEEFELVYYPRLKL